MVALCCAYCLPLLWAAHSFRDPVRTTCHPFLLEKSLLVSWHQLVLVQPDINRFPCVTKAENTAKEGIKLL